MTTSEDPTQSKIRKNLLFGFAYKEYTGGNKWKLHLRWSWIGITLFALMILGYLSLTTAAYFFYKYKRHYQTVSYVKTLVLPFRLTEHRREMGQFYLEKGKNAFDEKNYTSAYHLLRSGLRLYPEDAESRLKLAQYYLPNRRKGAIKLLEPRLEENINDPDYVKFYFNLLLAEKRDADIAEKAKALLAIPEDRDTQKILTLFAAMGNIYVGNFDYAETLLNSHDFDNNVEVYNMRAQIAWERGEQERAIDILESGVNKYHNAFSLYQQLSKYYLTIGELAAARRYAILCSNSDPLSAQPRVYLIDIISKGEDPDRTQKAIDQFIDDFGTEQNALELLANYAGRSGKLELVEHIMQIARDNDLKHDHFVFSKLEALISLKQYEKAVAYISNIVDSGYEVDPRHEPSFIALKAIANAGDKNYTRRDAHLRELLKQATAPANLFVSTSDRLNKMGHQSSSLFILENILSRFPDSQSVLSALIRTQLSGRPSDDFVEHVDDLLSVRRPSKELVSDVYDALIKDRFIYSPQRPQLLQKLERLKRSFANE